MIGQRQPALDSEARVSGRTGYALNAEAPGMLHVAVLRSEFAHAKVVDVDIAGAAAAPGVVAVLSRDTLPRTVDPLYGPVFRDQPVVALDTVRYVGEPVVAVAAESLDAAKQALSEVRVEYERLPEVFDMLDALQPGAPLLHAAGNEQSPGYADIIVKGRSGNICNKFTLRKGVGAAGLEQADLIFEDEFRTPAVQHVSMEPHAALATFEDGRLTVVTGTQTPYAVRDALAHMLGLPSSRVRVVVPPVGGAYGGKTYPKVEPIATVLAYMTGRPVKIVVAREDEFVTLSKHASIIRLRTGVQRDGTIVAREVRAWYNAGAYTDISPRLVKNGGYGAVGPYHIPHVEVESNAVFTNLPPAGAFRGYGIPQGAWAYESQMDIIAERLGIDPVELRRRNLIREGETFATGEPVLGAHFDRVLDDALSVFERDAAVDEPRPPAGTRVRRGRGCAVIIKSTITPSTSSSVLKMNSDGSVTILTSTVDVGQGSHTALSQIAADALDIPTGSIHVVSPDTDVTPYDLTTSSSRSTGAMGTAVRRGAVDIRNQLLERAAGMLEAKPDELTITDGTIHVQGDPERGLSIGQVVARSRVGTIVGRGDYMTTGGLDPVTGQGIASEHWHQGAAAVEVAVDLDTGRIRVEKLRATIYAGTVVNPVNARMQVEGSAIFGISQALVEQILYDEGHVANANLSDYALATGRDLPPVFEVSLLEDPDSGEVHGVGETALPPISPAIANAVADATGVRIRELPLTAERVLLALAEQEAE